MNPECSSYAFSSQASAFCVSRIPVKDKANTCISLNPRVTVARDGTAGTAPPPPTSYTNSGPPASRDADDARSAFDKLFKKL